MNNIIPPAWYRGPGFICPQCGYTRQTKEKAPKWQCPQCGIIYAKADDENNLTPQRVTPSMSTTPQRRNALRLIQHPGFFLIARIIDIMIILLIILLLCSWWLKGSLPTGQQLSPLVFREPLQTPTKAQPFSFQYRGNTIEVEPVADYKLWGIIASHNDINSLIWGYDKDDVNIKDICVLYGANLINKSYPKWKIWNKQWTCIVDLNAKQAVFYDPLSLSNNHLLAKSKHLRDLIHSLKVGDQVAITGMLVNYRSKHAPYWRRSSIRRDDVGNKACEVFFVQDLTILRRGTPGWYRLFPITFWLIVSLVVLRIIILLMAIHKQPLR